MAYYQSLPQSSLLPQPSSLSDELVLLSVVVEPLSAALVSLVPAVVSLVDVSLEVVVLDEPQSSVEPVVSVEVVVDDVLPHSSPVLDVDSVVLPVLPHESSVVELVDGSDVVLVSVDEVVDEP